MDLLLRRLNVVKKRKEALLLEEAKLARMARQNHSKSLGMLRVIRREKELVLREEAKIIRALKQARSAG
ncbi:hypothetical protein [Pyrococcus yayanosii]|uniref:Uncharacterized protein n=1 Tax=Pyrococcus yayanosii (strain CH1 / JCM 16557) TaxID=529709 RepID=F8AEC3_PYRYC|nr:hypothetical protein [Pyrococcus yayanosii]AEH24637.1 hypothetical protein PYCH_09520 [Pyrococcus yayanosii CH1]